MCENTHAKPMPPLVCIHRMHIPLFFWHAFCLFSCLIICSTITKMVQLPTRRQSTTTRVEEKEEGKGERITYEIEKETNLLLVA